MFIAHICLYGTWPVQFASQLSLYHMYIFLATCKTRDIFVIFSLVKEKPGCGFLASSLFVWLRISFFNVNILVCSLLTPLASVSFWR